MSEEELLSFLGANFGLFENKSMRGKKRSTVLSAIKEMMKKAKMSNEVASEIAEMMYDDIEIGMISSAEHLLNEI